MFPIVLNFDREELAILNEIKTQLSHIGFDFLTFGEEKIEINGINPLFETEKINLLFNEFIENKILEHYEVSVTQEDIVSQAKKLIAMQMRQYGQSAGDEKQLDEIANNILKNKDEKKKLHDQILDERTLVVYKENFKLNKKSISYDDFVKLASEKNKK